MSSFSMALTFFFLIVWSQILGTPLNTLSLLLVFWIALATLKFFSRWSHTLILLLTLEVFMLASTLALSLGVNAQSLSTELLFLFFTVAVCEASLGIAILITFSRSHGNDFISSL